MIEKNFKYFTQAEVDFYNSDIQAFFSSGYQLLEKINELNSLHYLLVRQRVLPHKHKIPIDVYRIYVKHFDDYILINFGNNELPVSGDMIIGYLTATLDLLHQFTRIADKVIRLNETTQTITKRLLTTLEFQRHPHNDRPI